MPTIQSTIQKVREFSQLAEGWHFGDGIPAPLERVNQAVKFLEFADLKGIERANAFPGARGQVEITFYIENRMLEVTIESDNSITIAEDHDNKQVYFEENLSRLDVYSKLEEFSQLWASSDLFIGSIMTQKVMVPVSQAWLLTSEPRNHFRLLTPNVQSVRVAPCVFTLNTITVSSLDILPFTGRYEMQIFLPDVELNQRKLSAAMNAIGTSITGHAVPLGKLLRP